MFRSARHLRFSGTQTFSKGWPSVLLLGDLWERDFSDFEQHVYGEGGGDGEVDSDDDDDVDDFDDYDDDDGDGDNDDDKVMNHVGQLANDQRLKTLHSLPSAL